MYTRLFFGIVLISMKWNIIWCKNIGSRLLPCDFQDSIDIAGGTTSPDGSILFDGIKYFKENFGTFHSKVNRTKLIVMDAHLRGCPCNVKPCLRLCCPLGSFVNTTGLQRGTILQEIPCYRHAAAKNYRSEVFDRNTNQSRMQILDNHFSYAVLLKPTKFYKLKNYQITNTGKIQKHNTLLDHHDYCIQADLNRVQNGVELNVLAFFDDVDRFPFKYIWSSMCMLTSVIFNAVTILIYVSLPELHNLHGNCLICYLICLSVGYLFTAWMKLDKWNYVRPMLCITCGHFMYFFLMSALIWSNVICYDLWRNFSTTNKHDSCCERRKFRFYIFYVLGLSSLLTMLIFTVDHFEQLHNDLLPGIGVETCFLQKKSSILYFYTPLLIISTMNIVFFILTALEIRHVQHDVAKMTSEKKSNRLQSNLNSKANNPMLFIRLFIVCNVALIMEGISYLISPENDNHFFTIFDIWNASQGPIIFLSFIMKRRVLLLIPKRCRELISRKTPQHVIVCDKCSVKLNDFNSNVFSRNVHNSSRF